MTREETWLLNEKYDGIVSDAFRSDCQRIALGEPLAYIIGYIPFLDCLIHLDSRPLIPRSETEYWTKLVREHWQDKADAQPLRILDLCAGSGCIGISLAKAWPSAHVSFAEIDPAHLPTMQKNINENLSVDTANRTTLFTSDLFTAVTGTFDLIVSNPPYIDPVLDRAEPNVRNYEPSLALYGGTLGFTLIQRILQEAPSYLNAGGELWLEHEPEQTPLFKEHGTRYVAITTHNDQYHTPRVSSLTVAS